MSDREMIDAAIAEGRFTRIPKGVSGVIRKQNKPAAETRFHPDHCGSGSRVDRRRFLDEIDGDIA